MMEDLMDRIWSCFHRISTLNEKKPPDRDSDEFDDPKAHAKITVTRSLSDDETTRKFIHLNPATLTYDKQHLESAFRDLLGELDLSPEKEKQLNEQSTEKKWLMILEQNTRKDKAQQAATCDGLVRRITEYVRTFPDKYSLPLAIQKLEGLAISLRTESVSYVQRFIGLDGVSLLVELLNKCRVHGGDCLAVPVLGCFRALLNSSIGRNCVLDSSETLLAISGALDFPRNSRCKILSLEILSGLCLAAEGGHKAVLKALTEATALLGERTRFQTLVDDLHREYRTQHSANLTVPIESETAAWNRETERVRIAVMSLVNALLKSGPAEQSVEFRLHLRYEFLMLGIQEVIDRLRNAHGQVLEDHFDLFEMMRQEDEQELATSLDSGSSSPIDYESPAGMAEALSQKLDNTVALPYLISLLQHMLMIPGDEKHAHLWKLFDLILQQLSLHTALGDFASADAQFMTPLQLDMDELMSRLRTHTEYEKLEKELQDTTMELENERKRVLELENRISDLQDGVSLSSFSRISDLSSSPSDPCHSPTFEHSGNGLPPVRPPTSLAPPPPPPSALQLRSGGGIAGPSTPQKKVPKPSCPLKTLNWTPVPYQRVNGTVWEKIEDEKLYKQINLQDLASSFAASGKNNGDEGDNAGMNTIQRRKRAEPTQVSVIDSRRAQNCTIMLSKLKMSHREIRQTVLSMDEKGHLPRDMIEQMLKFVPSKDELLLLREAVVRHKSPTVLALADRFLYEVGQIPRYEQRLRCLHIIRTFNDRLDEMKPYLNAVIRASTTLTGNKKLKQFLALVLAIGNYLNHGKRSGNAQGFSVSSLTLIQGVKSTMRADRTLMHFIVELVEKKFPDLLKLKRELSSVYEAARFNRDEMDAELRLIEASLRELGSELAAQQKIFEQHQQLPATSSDADKSTSASNASATCAISIPDEPRSESTPTRPKEGTRSGRAPIADRFIPVVTAFLDSARKEFREAQSIQREMENKFTACTKFYAEENSPNKKCSPDEFFGAFSKCFNHFTECYQTIWEQREANERSKRQTLVRSIFAKKNDRKRNLNSVTTGKDFESLVNALQSGEIFSEDLSRLRTSIRIPQRSQRKPKSTGASQPPASAICVINNSAALKAA
ncbi:formin homology 2 domain-containing protein [Ditylenchus destructor]|nr:formin homology 2 domain-containing protein [Ditylenchus destructor]